MSLLSTGRGMGKDLIPVSDELGIYAMSARRSLNEAIGEKVTFFFTNGSHNTGVVRQVSSDEVVVETLNGNKVHVMMSALSSWSRET